VTAVADRPAPVTRRRFRVGRAVLWVLVAGLAVWALARWVGFDRQTPFAQLMAFTPYVGLAAVVVLLITLAARAWRPAAAAAVLVALFAAFLLPRMIPDNSPEGGERLRVLAFNARIGGASVPDLMALLRREKPDVLSIEELTPALAGKLTSAGISSLLPYQALRPELGASGTGLWARYPLTDARRMDPASGGFDQTVAMLRQPGRPAVEVGSAHPRPPLPQTQPWGSSHRWAGDIGGLPAASSSGPLRILAGDFNATLDHSPLRKLIDTGYVDAAAARGKGMKPTWPEAASRLPPVTIDHVLVDERAGVAAFRTHVVAGSDHKAIVADLLLPE
jgi:endonuclease/exonuclease/phosphatase (EEP) superfamily protein YafD